MVEIENGNLTLTNEPFELRTELASIGRDMESQARAHSAQINCPIVNFDALNIIADREKLRQILTRLIDNAIRFSEGGQIEVEAKEVASISDTARIRFVVRDDGPGISQEKQQLLFKAFIQNDLSDTRRHSGLGIGLSISQKIIEKMGGTLDVDSNEGNGATFHFTLDLPRAQAAEEAGDIPSPDAPTSLDTARTLRALVVDDNPINCMVVVGVMKRLGFETETALNGEQAVEKSSKTDYELIVMDCQMPVMDGYEATEQIREREKAAGTDRNPSVIIACTANGLESNRTKCIQAGMNDFLVKPIQCAHMEEALRKHGLRQP
jgi:CheY-like chemotaxis protein/anti-sigma regulatory factor (Ser/Thr protein kinase)